MGEMEIICRNDKFQIDNLINKTRTYQKSAFVHHPMLSHSKHQYSKIKKIYTLVQQLLLMAI